jgi:hypothetical protein
MHAIAKERKDNRDTYRPGQQCCNAADIKMVVTHGFWPDTIPHFSLPEGYKVIMLCKPGEKISLTKKKLDELRQIYLEGSSFFENNDKSSELTNRARRWFNGVHCSCEARLYIGGMIDVGGVDVATLVPNIDLEFGGSGYNNGFCDNWSGEINPTNPESTECKITCIRPGQQMNCDKYYFDDASNEEEQDPKYRPFDPYWEPKPSISLERLVQNEGPGTYLIISCMSGHTETLPSKNLRKAKLVGRLRQTRHRPTYDSDEKKWYPGEGPMTRRKSSEVRNTISDFLRNNTLQKQEIARENRLSTLRERRGGQKRKTRKHKRHRKKTKRRKKN